jgi:hypothetical protein
MRVYIVHQDFSLRNISFYRLHRKNADSVIMWFENSHVCEYSLIYDLRLLFTSWLPICVSHITIPIGK